MYFNRHLEAASGYAELGMDRESIAELNAIPERFQNQPDVLQMRLHHHMRRKRWAQALRVSKLLCRTAPDSGVGFLHAGFCLHRLGRTAEAKKVLGNGPLSLLKEPIYYYNMGCYEALLGNLRDAAFHLEISFRMDPTFRELAHKDPDLQVLRAVGHKQQVVAYADPAEAL